jgi:2-polyprenyl-3-methyl-5-hydroxy-6-metoxy-1,4-benzoquinol methylase
MGMAAPFSGDRAAVQARAQAQFAPAAQDYVTSATHARGSDLLRLVELAALDGHEQVLDVATGGGHAALALAPHAHHVIASDLTLPMLHAARNHLLASGATNVSFLRCAAEALPCGPATLDRVVCRVAAHHFADVQAFVCNAAACLRPGGLLLVSDHIGLEDAEADQFMDTFERWRDPSHVRAYSYAEWRRFCTAAGLTMIHAEDDPRDPYPFLEWTARMRMPEGERNALERWLLAAPAQLRKRFEVVESEGTVISLRSTFGIIVARNGA